MGGWGELGGGELGEVLHGVDLLEGPLGCGQHGRLIALEREQVVPALVADELGNGHLTPHRIDADQTVGDVEDSEEFGDGGDLIGFAIDLDLAEEQVLVDRPGIDEVDGAVLLAVVAPLEGLAIDGEVLAGQAPQQPRHPRPEPLLHLIGVQSCEHPAEGVVAGGSVRQRQVPTKPVLARPGERRHLHPAVRTTHHRQQRDHEDGEQLVLPGTMVARILKVGERGDQRVHQSARVRGARFLYPDQLERLDAIALCCRGGCRTPWRSASASMPSMKPCSPANPRSSTATRAASSPARSSSAGCRRRGSRSAWTDAAATSTTFWIERLWRSVKYEEVYINDYHGLAQARQGLGRWFPFYNFQRPHQALGYRTPADLYGRSGGHADRNQPHTAAAPQQT